MHVTNPLQSIWVPVRGMQKDLDEVKLRFAAAEVPLLNLCIYKFIGFINYEVSHIILHQIMTCLVFGTAGFTHDNIWRSFLNSLIWRT